MARTTRSGYVASPTFDSVLKRFYDDKLFPMYPTWFPTLDLITKGGKNINKVNPQGEKIYFGVELKIGSGAGPRGENSALPDADPVANVQGSVDYNKGLKGRIAISAETLKFMKKGKGAFADGLKQESRGLVNAIKMEANPLIWGVGDGILAKTSALVSGSTTVNVVSSELSSGMFPGTRWLHEGGRLDCFSDTSYTADGSWTASGDTNKIASITSDTSFELEAANTTAGATRYFVSAGGATAGTASSFEGPQGLLAMVDDGALVSSYCGIDESSYPQWKGVVSDNSGTKRSLTLMQLYRHYNKMGRKIGKIDPEVMAVTNQDLFLEVVNLLEHYVEGKPQSLKGGFKDVEVAIHGYPIKFRLDPAAPGAFFFLNPRYISFAEGCPLKVVDEDGQTMTRLADYDSFEMRWRWIWNTYTTKRNAHGMLADYTYTVSV